MDILTGHDVFAMLPTGSGKSMCYLLPGKLNDGLTIIVSPLLALMEDQVQGVRALGERRVAAYNSFLTLYDKRRILQQLSSLRYLYVSPEALNQAELLSHLKNVKVSLFVVDEAHCVSQWGHEFRPDYMKLLHVRHELGDPQCLALTATADERVKQDIIQYLGLTNTREHIDSIDRPNIAMKVDKFERVLDKQQRLIKYTHRLQTPGIVYFSTKEWAERGAALIADKTGLRTAYYHGGLDTEDRLLIQQQFINDQLDVICCTNAFGMGVNKSNVRFVIHYDMPKNITTYIQEMGRAGRDGKPSLAIMLFAEEDVYLPSKLIQSEYPNGAMLAALLDWYQERSNSSEADITTYGLELGMSETAARFTAAQLQKWGHLQDQGQLRDKIESQMVERLNIKQKELQDVVAWIKGHGCRRDSILHHFGEQKETAINGCCDVCGLDVEVFMQEETNAVRPQQIPDWRTVLQNLLVTGG